MTDQPTLPAPACPHCSVPVTAPICGTCEGETGIGDRPTLPTAGDHEQAGADRIVASVCEGFRQDLKRILADEPKDELTRAEQCALVAEASGWRARALAAEARLKQPSEDEVERVAILLWHRFAHESHIEWEDEREKAIYRDAAIAALREQSSSSIEKASE